MKGFDFTRLTGVHSLGMNAAYRFWDKIDWYPTYYSCLDDQLIISHHDEIYRLWKEGRIQRFFVHGSFFDYHPDCIGVPEFFSLDQVLPHWYNKRGKGQGWVSLVDNPAFKTQDTTKITTGAFATRFCAFMGHDTLALMGIDLKYVEILPEAEKAEGVALVMKETPKENPNYFFDDYQKAGDKYNIPNPDVHGNELHIQSFRLVKSDFQLNGQKTVVYNSNPNSLLHDEMVFPLRLIDSVLTSRHLAAVVVPATQFEFDAILSNFDIWSRPETAPSLDSESDNNCGLVFMFNKVIPDEVEFQIRNKFLETGMNRYFSYLKFEYLGLEGDDDKYERDYSKKVGTQGFKSGPNNQFFLTMRRARGLGDCIFQMETDCVPLAANWLTNLRKEVARSGRFWVLGTRYFGTETLAPEFKNHLNGNAVYATGDPEFCDFLDTFWEPRTRAMVRTVDKRLAYDCILEKVFVEQADSDPEVAEVLQRHGTKFRQTGLILNISGKADLKDLSPFYRRDLQDRFPDACVLHNRTAQKWAATEAAMAARLRTASQTLDHPAEHPRLLVIDMTQMGNASATGAVKSNLLRGWPQDRLLQVACPTLASLQLVRPTPAGGFSSQDVDEAAVVEAVEAFRPDVILYRQLPERPALHALAMQLIDQYDVPLVTWLMDDWPARLYSTDKALFHEVDRDLRALLARSALRLSICDAMSRAFEARYGHSFVAMANGVDPRDWAAPKAHTQGTTVLRYAGGLAPDMNAKSIQRVAQAVEELVAEGHDIRFEINTQSWWVEKSRPLFEGLKATKIEAVNRPFKAYSAWLQEADGLLISYNFDPESLRYVMFSMANKLPECLISGAALMVHGPREVATVEYAAQTDAAIVVDAPEIEAVKAGLLELCDPARRTALTETGREVALARHNLPVLSRTLADMFREVVENHGRAPRQEATAPVSEVWTQFLPAEDPPVSAGKPPVVLSYRRCADYVSQSLSAGLMPDEALQVWLQEAKVLVTKVRRARRQTVLIDAADAAAAPEALAALVADRALPVSDADVQRLQAAPPRDRIHDLIAEEAVRQSPLARRLGAELEASSTPLGEQASRSMDVAGALSDYRDRSARSQHEQALRRRESDLLHDRIARLEVALSDARAGQGAAAAEIGGLRRSLEVLEDIPGSLKQAHDALTAERAAHARLLADLDSQKARATTEQAEHEKRVATLQAQAAAAQASQKELEQKLEAQAQQIRALTTARDDAVAENRLLASRAEGLQQAQRVSQEHLRDSVRALADQDRKTGDLEQEIARQAEAATAAAARQDQIQTALSAAQSQLSELRKSLASEREKTAGLEEELTRIYNSKSWMITGPMRGTRRVLNTKVRAVENNDV
ncbi:hypothetical protein [Flavimaricola marinus]|uniref:hypothetical protein n=1 Tax=Flavimaricola marinus TaxID=1819565 RepID=UPI000B8A6297|nr:hypothetical protein [Flavimaricola marinus]